MDGPKLTMEESIRIEEEKAHRCGKVYNWETATYALSCEHTVSSLNDEIDFRISFDESDDEVYKENDDDKVDIAHSSVDLFVKPLSDVIYNDAGAYAQSKVYMAYSLNEYRVYRVTYSTIAATIDGNLERLEQLKFNVVVWLKVIKTAIGLEGLDVVRTAVMGKTLEQLYKLLMSLIYVSAASVFV
nr:hypothetical protein [Tanacetum cinerariifolium]